MDRCQGGRYDLAITCLRWRGIMLGTPAIWSSLYLRLPFQHRTPDRWLSEALTRSKNVALSINLILEAPSTDSQPNTSTAPETDVIQSLQILFATSNRWKSLKLNITGLSTTNIATYLAPLHHNIYLLKDLTITSSESSLVESSSTCDVFSNAPCLRILSLTRASSSFFRVPWKQLINLDISVEDYSHIGRDLLCSIDGSELRDVTLVFKRDYRGRSIDIPADPDVVVTLPKARKLHITSHIPVGCMRMPALEELSIHLDGTEKSPVFDYISAFIRESQCSLTSLSIANWDITLGENVASVLRFLAEACGALETLCMRFLGDDGDGLGDCLTFLAHKSFGMERLKSVTFIVNRWYGGRRRVHGFQENMPPILSAWDIRGLLLTLKAPHRAKILTSLRVHIWLEMPYPERQRFMAEDDFNTLLNLSPRYRRRIDITRGGRSVLPEPDSDESELE
ncbi:hypothetical protein BDZ89DRAFT_1162227 [Hymenopellis radicata]|nr:hypothetical protein BDZ89DRAFT_1162227 [Hymenopellis radicata]